MASTSIQNTLNSQEGTSFQSLFYLSVIPTSGSTNQFQPSGASYGYITSFQFQLSAFKTVGDFICNTITKATTLSYNSLSWTTLLNAFGSSKDPIYFAIFPINVTVSLSSSSDSTVGLSWNVGDVETGQVTDTLSFSPGDYSQSSVTVPQLTIQYDKATDEYFVVQNGNYDLNVASFLPFSQLYNMITAVSGTNPSSTGLNGLMGKLTLQDKALLGPTCGACACQGSKQITVYQMVNTPTVLLSNADLSTPLLFQNTSYSENQGVIFLDNGFYGQAYCNLLPKFSNGKRVSLVTKNVQFPNGKGTPVGPMYFPVDTNRCWGGRCTTCFGKKLPSNCCAGATVKKTQIIKPCPTSFFPGLLPVGSITTRSKNRQQASFYEQIGNPGQYLKNITTIPGNKFQRQLIQTKNTANFNGSINSNPTNSFCGGVLMQFTSANADLKYQYYSGTCQVYMIYYTKSVTFITTLQYVSNTGLVTENWGTYQYCQPLTDCPDLEVNLDVTITSTTTTPVLFVIEDMPEGDTLTCDTNDAVSLTVTSSPYSVAFGNTYTFFNSVYGGGVYFTSTFTDSITFVYSSGDTMNVTFPTQQYDAINFNFTDNTAGNIIALGYPPTDVTSYSKFAMTVTSNLFQDQTFFVAFVDQNFNSLVGFITPDSAGQCGAYLEYSSQSGWTWPTLYLIYIVLIQDSVTLLYLSYECDNTTNPTGVCLTDFQGENNLWLLGPSDSTSYYAILPYNVNSEICLSAYASGTNGCTTQAPCFQNGNQENSECLWSLSSSLTSGNPFTTSFQAQCGGDFQGQYLSASTCSASFPAPCMGGDEYSWIVTPVVLFF